MVMGLDERQSAVTADASRLTFGIKTSQADTTYERIAGIWRDADEVPAFEHAWLWDHLVPLRGPVTGTALEAWTLLGALAGQTRRLRLGVIVTSNRIRPPAVLAKMAATVDQISGGRLVFGIGAGGSAVADPAGRALVEREYGAYGIAVVSPGEAVGALAEACTIARRLWQEDLPFDFDGRFYRLTGAICEPKPVQRPRPPILIGAAGRRALEVVAEHADIWNCPTRGDVAEFRRLSEVLDEQCAAIGRDPASIVRSVQLLVSADPTGGGHRQPALPGRADAAATRDLVLAFVDAGVRHIVLAPIAPGIDRPARWLAEAVVEPVMAQLG
jgi:alkanesulfonate monooxygenase SsuD/methylene tetrahydromethanopterin reductase-like flavin-dependent oxidoreductase (luciferase family)